MWHDPAMIRPGLLRHAHRLALGLALVAFAVPPARAGEVDLERCVSYRLPAGWGANPAAPEHFPATTFFAPDTWTWVDRKLRDHLRITDLSDYDITLKTARLLYTTANMTEGIRPAVELTAHEFPDRPLAILLSPPQAPATQTVTVGGRPAERYDTEADVKLDDAPPRAVHATVWLVDVRGGPLAIDTGYPVSRAAEVKPLIDTFVASIGFDACR